MAMLTKTTVSIEIQNPEEVAHDLSDLLCWWEGFQTGMKMNDEYFSSVANNGIKIARDLNSKIKNEIQKSQSK
jgi:hypothetical protein